MCLKMTEDQKSINQGLGCLVALGVIAFFLYFTFSNSPAVPKEIDATGYISHKVESTITADSNWLIGESRTCVSNPLDPTSAEELHKPVGYALWGLQCSGGESHRITITFWGSAIQTGNKAAYWNCARTSDSFTCKQTEAH